MVTLNTVSNKTKIINAETLALMSEKERSEISVIKILPPSLDSGSSFGKVLVESRHPTYEVAF